MSMKQYSNTFSNFTVTKTVTENTKWDSKKEKHIKLAKPKVDEEKLKCIMSEGGSQGTSTSIIHRI